MTVAMTSRGIFTYRKVLPFFVSGPLGTVTVAMALARRENNKQENERLSISWRY
jgi:hypothetical protein